MLRTGSENGDSLFYEVVWIMFAKTQLVLEFELLFELPLHDTLQHRQLLPLVVPLECEYAVRVD